MSATNIPVWQGVVDWSQAGDFAGALEDISPYMAANPGLTIELGLDSARSFSPPRMGKARVDLLNKGQEFSADFPGSPIYSLMKPARAVEYRVSVGDSILYDESLPYDSTLAYDGTFAATVFTGQTEELPQDPSRSRRRVGLTSIGTLTRLRGRRREGRKISTELFEAISSGDAVTEVLDAAGWPADKRVVDTGSTVLTYWWLDEEEPYKAILDILAIEGPQAAFYEDGEGVLHFEGRNYRALTTRSNTSQAEFDDEAGTGNPYHVRPFNYDQGFKNVINQCLVETQQREVGALGVNWEYGGGSVSLLSGETFSITAKPTDPFKDAVCTNGVDVTVTSGAVASVTLSRTSGGNTDIVVTADAAGATIDLIRLRAKPITVVSSLTVTNTVDASVSIAEFELQDHKISARRDIAINEAVAICDAVVLRYMDPLPTVSFTVSNHGVNHLYQQFSRQISDRVTVREQHTGVDYDVHINQIVHRAIEGGLIHYTTFVCEKAPPIGEVYVWDDPASEWGTAEWGS